MNSMRRYWASQMLQQKDLWTPGSSEHQTRGVLRSLIKMPSRLISNYDTGNEAQLVVLGVAADVCEPRVAPDGYGRASISLANRRVVCQVRPDLVYLVVRAGRKLRLDISQERMKGVHAALEVE